MASHKSANKRIRQIVKRTIQNKRAKNFARSLVKSLVSAIGHEEQGELINKLHKVESAFGKLVKKGIMHKNTAARKISRLNKKIKKNLNVQP